MRAAGAPGSGRRALLALLVTAALLVCHGLLGASHVLAHGESSRPEQPAMGHSSALHHGAGHAAAEQTAGGDAPAAHVGATEYFAVLLVLAGAALLGALLGAVASPLGGRELRAFASRRWIEPQPLSRGHSPPFLQVFRL